MDADPGGLERRLEAYPQLRQALGQRWINDQENVEPVLSPFRLARWLRLDGFAPDLTTFDAVLARLASVPGIADRRKRLRTNPEAFMETTSELYFGAWLLDRGCQFDLPDAGPDFALDLRTDQPLRIEVTTPRKAVWSDDLFERIDLITHRTGFSAEIEFSLERLPDPSASEETVGQVVRDALARLTVNPPPEFPVRQEFPDIGLSITWTNEGPPYVGGLTSPSPTSPYWGWNQVVATARAKEGQFPVDQAGVLLIDTRQMPTLEWDHFLNLLEAERIEDLGLDWSGVPPQIQFIVLWSHVFRQVEPWSGLYLLNPASPFPIRPEVAEFFQTQCP